jgi:hypothetical protein
MAISKWKFEAVLVVDDRRTGYKKGMKLDPKGFYYNGRSIVLVGSVGDEHTIRLSFPIDAVKVKVTKV